MFNYHGLIGLIILIADIFAIIKVLKSKAPDTEKILWVIIILLLPLIGVILWYFMGPGDKSLSI